MTIQILETLIALVSRVAPADMIIFPESRFDDMALNGLATIELVIAIDEKFDVFISSEERLKLETLTDVARLIDERLCQAA